MRHSVGTTAIAPLGKVNINTGTCKWFNIYETWKNDDTTWELYKSPEGTLKLVATSGPNPINKKPRQEFHSDQSMRYLGNWEYLGSTLQSNLKQFATDNGFTKIDGYTYK